MLLTARRGALGGAGTRHLEVVAGIVGRAVVGEVASDPLALDVHALVVRVLVVVRAVGRHLDRDVLAAQHAAASRVWWILRAAGECGKRLTKLTFAPASQRN